MNDSVMCSELLQKDLVCVDRSIGDDSEVLETHGVAGGFEVVDEIDELGVDICACASVCGLRVDDIWTTGQPWLTPRADESSRRDVLDFGLFFFFGSASASAADELPD